MAGHPLALPRMHASAMHKFVGVVQTEMVSSLKEVVGDLKGKFAPGKYADDPGLLKQRVKEQGDIIVGCVFRIW